MAGWANDLRPRYGLICRPRVTWLREGGGTGEPGSMERPGSRMRRAGMLGAGMLGAGMLRAGMLGIWMLGTWGARRRRREAGVARESRDATAMRAPQICNLRDGGD
jgi:hypothetical protein